MMNALVIEGVNHMTPTEEILRKIQLKQQSIMLQPEKMEKFREDIRDLRRTLWVFEDLQRIRDAA